VLAPKNVRDDSIPAVEQAIAHRVREREELVVRVATSGNFASSK